MRKAEVDYLLGTMLDFDSGVSDLNITADKPFQVESSGELVEVVFDPPIGTLTPFQTETLALNLINGSRRLTQDLLKTGSCDQSYSLGQKGTVPGQHLHPTRSLHDHPEETFDRNPIADPVETANGVQRHRQRKDRFDPGYRRHREW